MKTNIPPHDPGQGIDHLLKGKQTNKYTFVECCAMFPKAFFFFL